MLVSVVLVWTMVSKSSSCNSVPRVGADVVTCQTHSGGAAARGRTAPKGQTLSVTHGAMYNSMTQRESLVKGEHMLACKTCRNDARALKLSSKFVGIQSRNEGGSSLVTACRDHGVNLNTLASLQEPPAVSRK